MMNQITCFEFRNEFKDKLIQALKLAEKSASQLEECIEMSSFLSKDNSNTIYMYNRWTSKIAFEQHMKEVCGQYLEQVLKSALNCSPVHYVLEENFPLLIPSKRTLGKEDLCIVFFIFKIDIAYRAELLAQFKEHIEQTRKEDGNLLFDLYTVKDSSDNLAVYGHWRKETDFLDVHFKQDYTIKTGDIIKKILIGKIDDCMHFVKEID